MQNLLTDELDRGISAIAADRQSGASEILDAVIRLLRKARDGDVEVPPIARALCRAQPSMAPVWTAAIEAVADELEPGRFDRFAHRVARAPKSLARFATEFFKDEESDPLQVVTISLSRSVTTVLDAIRRQRPLRVACSESRPALEGRVLAARLAEIGVPMTLYSDAAIADALVDADAVMLGADAVTAEWVLNKSGSYMLAAAAAQRGVPVHVAATREKFVGPAVARRLAIRQGSPDEIWDTPPPGVDVRNPYFEAMPLDLVAALISDIGILGAGMIPEVCRSLEDEIRLRALDDLVR
jgi:translation initiation factor 2B subunit (eIF-2B alpha/beta/delta family)